MTVMKLPPQLPENLQTRANIVSAYDLCLNLERGILEETKSERDSERSLVLCRILGYLLYYIPMDVGQENVALEIHSCSRDRKGLLQLGETYLDHFIRPCTFSTSQCFDLHLTHT